MYPPRTKVFHLLPVSVRKQIHIRLVIELGADIPEHCRVQVIIFGVGLAAHVVAKAVCFSCYVVAPHQDPLLGQDYQFRSDVCVHADDLGFFVPSRYCRCGVCLG